MPAAQAGTPHRPLQVLLISDSPADLAEVTRALRPFPMLRLEQAANQVQLTAAMAAGRFDLALVESHLTYADGLAVLRSIQTGFPGRPVLLIVDAAWPELAGESALSGPAGIVVRAQQQLVCLATAVRLALEHAQELQAKKEVEARYRDQFDAAPVGSVPRNSRRTHPGCQPRPGPDAGVPWSGSLVGRQCAGSVCGS